MSHTADNVASELKSIAEEWHISNKIVAVLSDNATNMKAGIHWKWKQRHIYMIAFCDDTSLFHDFFNLLVIVNQEVFFIITKKKKISK